MATEIAHKLKVAKKKPETPSTVSLQFEIPPELKPVFEYQPGQFVTLFMTINGEAVPRSYSFSSTPMIDENLQVTVKRVEGGKGSNYLLDEVQEGDLLNVSPPAGHFFEITDRPRNHHFFVAGSGITPVYSILKYLLAETNDPCWLVYGNRDANDVIFKTELEELQSKHPDQLKVHYLLSRQAGDWDHIKGRLSDQACKEIYANQQGTWGDASVAYLCGPHGFMQTAQDFLTSVGLAESQIRKEDFSPPMDQASGHYYDDNGRLIVGNKSLEAPAKTLVAIIDDSEVEIQIEDPEESLLESLLNEGQNPPFSCMAGSCMACMAELEEGLIYQDDAGILTDEDLEQNKILTCQAKAISEKVRVRFVE